MSQSGSYRIQTIAVNVDAELNRLQAQVELFWENERIRYENFGLRDGMRIVELGSGPGFLTEKLLTLLPAAKVTAVEIDPFLVDFARTRLEQARLDRFEVLERSALETELPDNAFDIAIVRLLLEHLPEPMQAIREIRRILKPGGRTILVDNDFDMHVMTSPPIPELRELYDAYCASRIEEGGNPRIGRELPILLRQCGFDDIRFDIVQAHSEIVGEDLFLRSEGIGIPAKLVKSGHLSSKTMGRISLQWRDMLNNERHAIVRQLFMAAGTKT